MSRSTKILAVFGAAFVLPLRMAVVEPQSSLSTSVFAEEEKKQPKYKDVKTRKRQSVGARCAKALEKVQPKLEEEDWATALEMLADVEANTKTCKTDYEQTQVWKFAAYVHYSLEDYNQFFLLNKTAYKQME